MQKTRNNCFGIKKHDGALHQVKIPKQDNLGYIDQTRRRLKSTIGEHYHKAKNDV